MPRSKNEREYIINNALAYRMWDYAKNEKENLDPSYISCGSQKYAYFICPICSKSWRGIIRDAIRQEKCPECRKKENIESRRKNRKEAKNSLAITNPELLEEWVYEENDKLHLTPYTVSCFSTIKVIWRCPKCNYTYESIIRNRTEMHSGCPYCSGQKVKRGYNDFATMRVDLLAEWDYEKNYEKGIKPDNVTCGSRIKANWICPLGHKYVRSIKERTAGRNCSVCGKRSQTSFPEQALFYYIKQFFPDAKNRYRFEGKVEIDIYIPSKYVGIEYDGVYYHNTPQRIAADQKKEAYLINKGITLYRIKEVEQDIALEDDRILFTKADSAYNYLNTVIRQLLEKLKISEYDIDIKRDIINIYSQYLDSQKEQSLWNNKELMKEWDKRKNGTVNPRSISNNSHMKVYWICKLGHSYIASPKTRNHGTGCPYCAGKKVLKGFNDLKSFAENNMPELLEEWDYLSNKDTLEEIYFNTLRSYMWTCPKCGRKYEKSVYARNKGGACSYCAHKLVDREISFGYLHPEALKDWDYEKNSSDPYSIAEHSNKYAYWKCHKCGRETYSIINNRSKGHGCAYCSVNETREKSHQIRIEKRGSLAEKKPLLVNEWDFHKNDVMGISPDNITGGSGAVVWWKCSKCEHQWKDEINKRSHGKKCPQCGYTPYPKAKKIRSKESKEQQQEKIQINANITRVKKRGSLRQNKPLLAQEWNMEKMHTFP